MPLSFQRTVRLKVRAEAYGWLNAAAVEVNQVFNWCNATSDDAADRNRRAKARFLSGFDLCNLSAGATQFFERIGADTRPAADDLCNRIRRAGGACFVLRNMYLRG